MLREVMRTPCRAVTLPALCRGIPGVFTMLPSISRAACLAGLFFIFSGVANAQVVVSQIYGANGNALARDYVELFNRGSSSASLAGLSVQYASATGTGNFTVAATLSGSIPAGGYVLVGLASSMTG